MTDKLFEEFNEKILSVINENPNSFLNPAVCEESKTFDSFWKIGGIFKERLEMVNIFYSTISIIIKNLSILFFENNLS